MDTVRPMTYCELQTMLDGILPPGQRNYWKSSFLPDLKDDAVEKGDCVREGDALAHFFSSANSLELSKKHFHGILAYLETRLTNAAIEAINGLLQMAKRIARGFRNFHYFRLAAYLKASRLHLQPHPLPT